MNKILLEKQSYVFRKLLSGQNLLCSGSIGNGKTTTYLSAVYEKAIHHKQKSLIISPTKEIGVSIYRKFRLFDSANQVKVTRLGSLGFMAPIVELINDESLKQRPDRSQYLMRKSSENLESHFSSKFSQVIFSTLNQMTQILDSGRGSNFIPDFIVLDDFDLIVEDQGLTQVAMQIVANYQKSQILLMGGFIDEPLNNHPLIKNKKCEVFTYDSIFESKFRVNQLEIENQIQTIKSIALNTNKKLIVFTDSVENCENINKALVEQQVRSILVHSGLATEIRIQNLHLFLNKDNNVLITTHLCSREFDFPGVEHVVMYELPQTESLFYQQIGRVNRLGKLSPKITVFTKDTEDKELLTFYLSKLQKYIV